MESGLGKRIRYLRKKAGLTQDQFGKIFNLAKSTVSQYETGKSNPDDVLKKRIATYFGVSLDWLLGLEAKKSEYTQSSLLEELYVKENSPIDLKELLKKKKIFFCGQELTDKDKSDIINFVKYVIKKR